MKSITLAVALLAATTAASALAADNEFYGRSGNTAAGSYTKAPADFGTRVSQPYGTGSTYAAPGQSTNASKEFNRERNVRSPLLDRPGRA